MDKKEDNPLILIVDDDPGLLRVTEIATKRGGYRTLTAPNGLKALELVRSQAEKIDLLLTDINMPGINGLDLAEMFVIYYPDTKILFMSGSVDFEEIFLGHEGLQNKTIFLEKPFSISDLNNKIMGMLG